MGATLVVYAAKGGTSAEDGEGDVLRKTGNHQEPFVYGSLPPDDFYFVPPK
jgi:hypothetical protein